MADRRFTFFASYRDVAQLMTDEERLAFYDALVAYAIDGEEPDGLEGSPLIAFTMAKPSLDKSARRSKANSRNASKPRKQPESPNEPEPAESETERTVAKRSETERTESDEPESLRIAFPDIDIDEDIDSDFDEDSDRDEDEDTRGVVAGANRFPRPHPPTFDEWWGRWRDVATARGVPPDRVEAESGFAYYDANGWRQNNGNPIRRWRGALMTCFLRAHPELSKRERKEADGFDRYD